LEPQQPENSRCLTLSISYLAKLAMDITAKHAAPDKDGVRIAELDEESFRYLLWEHKPLTDFWMTGPGTV
jgi:DNA polymerase V